jgi:hypothetical protein
MHTGQPLHQSGALLRLHFGKGDTHADIWLRMGDLAQGHEFFFVVSDGDAHVCAHWKRIHRIDITAVQTQVARSGIDTCVEFGLEKLDRSKKRVPRFPPVLNVHVQAPAFSESAEIYALSSHDSQESV